MGKKNTESTSSEGTGASATSATPSAIPVGVADLEGIIQKAIDAALNVLRTEFDKVFTEMNQRIDSHSDEIVMLKNENAELHKRLNAVESYSRIDNLLFCGLPESYASVSRAPPGPITRSSASLMSEPSHSSSDNDQSGTNRDISHSGGDAMLSADQSESQETTLLAVINYCQNNLNIEVTPNDISAVHRLPKGKYDRVRPVIVRFSNRRVRDQIFTARRRMRPSRTESSSIVYVNEHLSKTNEQLFSKCRMMYKNKQVARVWTWHGTVCVKRNDSRIVKVLSMDDLSHL